MSTLLRFIGLPLLWSVLTASSLRHPLKICTCTARYAEANQEMSLQFRFFTDDLQASLEQQTGKSLNLQVATPENQQLISALISRQFCLKINGNTLSPQVVSYKIDDIVLEIGFTASGIIPASSYQVELRNEILMDVFTSQYNIVRFDFFNDGNLETMRFEKQERLLVKKIGR